MGTYIVQIGIPIIGVIAAIVSATVSYYFTKKNQLESDERRLKEKYYLEYIQAVSDIVVKTDIESARDRLADAQNQLLLVGSSDVVKKLMEFHDYIKPSGKEEHGFLNDIHDNLLNELIKCRRKDLYKNQKINQLYPIVHLTGKN